MIQSSTETALIAALLQDNTAWLDVRALISSDDFTDGNCAAIFKGLEELEGKSDYVIMSAWLTKNQRAELRLYVNEISDHGNSLYTMHYAREIKEASTKRKIQSVADGIKVHPGSSEEVLREAEGKIISLYSTDQKGFRGAVDMTRDYASRMAMLASKGLEISGLSSGLGALDCITDGFKDGELIVIGARPSIGKTSLMVGIADHISLTLEKNVCIFSIESPEVELIHRFLSRRVGISAKKLRTGKFCDGELVAVSDALELLSRAPLWVNDVSTIDIMSMRAQIKKMMNRGDKPDIIMIDYLQIMDVEKGYDTFATKLGRVVQGLKNIAKELPAPVVVLAQINRNNEERSPRLMDLKDSGAIESIADMVILLHREEFYKGDKCEPEKKGKIEIHVAKNRNGPVGLLELNWTGEYTRISEPNSFSGRDE